MLMNKVGKIFLLLCTTLLVLTACRKKAFDEYYGRPATLEPPIYQSLQAKGRFSTLLSVIDKSGYKNTLSAAGYWTFFAPNDSAFQVYFRENSIGGVGQLDSNACQKIVTYCLVYYAFNKDRIDDYQSNTGWQVNAAYKRRTANYTGVYNTTDQNGTAIQAIAANRNTTATGNTYIDADQGNKYIPIFTDTFFRSSNLTTADYNYFYPNSTFSGFNVVDASILEKNIPAENGVIHEVSRVITALPNIDEYIGTKPEYSEFKKLFDKYLVQYVLNATVTQNWNNRGHSGQVFTKVYNGALAFSPNNENWLKIQDNDGQFGSYTLFAPTNAVLLNYINTVLLENYPSGSTLDAVPRQILYDFVNAHMWLSAVWPSRFANSFSYLNEPARFNPTTNIVDKKVLSNGIFYGTNKVQEANVFTTVYGRAYLDPNYSIMQQLMASEIRSVITNPSQKYTVFMMSNAAIAAAGYSQDPLLSADVTLQWRFTPPAGSPTNVSATTGAAAYQRLLRLLNMHIIPGEITSLAGTGIVQSYGGEYVVWNNNTIRAVGNGENTIVANRTVNITGSKISLNGRVYYCDKILQFTETTIGKSIEALATASPTVYGKFFNYLKGSGIYNTSTGDITGLTSGVFYTVLIPNDTSINRAITDGFLPASATSTLPADMQKMANFVYYHILNKRAEAADGVQRGAAETLLFNSQGNPTSYNVVNSATILQIGDNRTPSGTYRAQTVPAFSNVLANRAIIHSINNYLRYDL